MRTTTSLNIEGSGKTAAHYARRFRPRLWPTLAAALLIPLFLAAGHWQWHKAAVKAERQQQFDTLGAQAALRLPPTPVNDPQALEYRQIVARGQYESQFQILIDNRTYREQAGYHVVTPLHLEGSEVRLIVNRGWIPAPADRRSLPPISTLIRTPPETVEVSGMAVVPAKRFFSLGEEENDARLPSVWQHLDLARYAKVAGFPIHSVVMELAPDSPAGGFVREWRHPGERRQVNLSYALQWWSFAATTCVLWLVFSFRRSDENS